MLDGFETSCADLDPRGVCGLDKPVSDHDEQPVLRSAKREQEGPGIDLAGSSALSWANLDATRHRAKD